MRNGNMIRKCVIGIYSLATIWLCAEWVSSYIWPKEWSSERRWDSSSDSSSNPGYRINAGIITQSGSQGMLDNHPRRFSLVCLLKRIEDSATTQSIPVKRPWNRSIFFSEYSEFTFGMPMDNGTLWLHYRCLQTPAWMPLLLFASYPAYAFIRGPLRRRRRWRRGLCVKCGYNLTRAPESRCPECGTTFKSKTRKEETHDSPQRGEGS